MLEFGIKDVIDVVLFATLLYYIYRLMKASRSLNIFIGIMFFVFAWLIVSEVLEMRLMGNVLSQLVNVGAIGLIVLFKDEIRQFFYTVGAHQRVRRFARLIGMGQTHRSVERETIMPIVMACMSMSRQKVGALIIIEEEMDLSSIVATGELVDAKINQRLIENIFFKNSPMHDGAMIISKKRIKAAGCILPVAHDFDIPKEFGLRHRAALGISQQTDAMAVVVSEETGRITVAENGKFRLRVSAEELESLLEGNS